MNPTLKQLTRLTFADMKFDRKKFYDNYRAQFGSLTQYQKDGLERLLWGFETYYGWWDLIPQIANAFSQVKHESAHSFQPVVEGFYLAKNVPVDQNYYHGNYDVVRRFQKQLAYYPAFGMGDIQLTHLENYEEMDVLVRRYFPELVAEFEMRTNQEFNLIKYPRQVLDGKISFAIFTIGMHKGTFREGHNLDRYITPTRTDHYNARSIVNGDKKYKVKGSKPQIDIGTQITNWAKKFETILNNSLMKEPTFIAMDDEPTNDFVPADPADFSNPPDDYSNDQPSQSSTASDQPAAVDSQTPEQNGVLASGSSIPQGDAPTDEAKFDIKVQDFKPFVQKWLKFVWRGFRNVNLPQLPALGASSIGMMSQGIKWWWVALAAAALIFMITLFAAVVVSAVLLLILFWNRIENFASRRLADVLKASPNFYNPKIETEVKGK